MPKKKSKNLTVIKHPLKTIIRNSDDIIKIQKIVLQVNRLRTHVLQFTKLYFLHLSKNNENIPVIDRAFLRQIIKLLTLNTNKKKSIIEENIILCQNLTIFYNDHYKHLRDINEDKIIIESRTLTDYMIIDIITVYENNIKMHMYDYIKNFINCAFDKHNYNKNIKKIYKNDKISIKECINMKQKFINKILNDFYTINTKDFKSPKYIHNWILFQKSKIFPKRPFEKDSINYDLQCHPYDYIGGLIYMNTFCEQNDYKIFNTVPLKRNIIPGHIRFDTESIIDIFIDEKCKAKKYKCTGGIEMFKGELWNRIFNLDKKVFKPKSYLIFNGSIQTDGFSVSILFEDTRKKINTKKFEEKYIDEIGDTKSLKNFVTIDPNKDDLIYCMSKNLDNKFRYTQNQRNKEIHIKKHRKILEKEKLNNFVDRISEVDSFNLDRLFEQKMNINECEKILSKFNSKTNDIELFSEYIKNKNEINNSLMEFYENILWRKLRMSRFVKTKQSEMKMLKNFENKFGKPDEIFIAFGDWSQKNQMKYKEPTKGKSFRSLFRKAGYKVYLVDEYRTSKKCCKCKDDSECETFLKVLSPRPWKKNEYVIRHGLVKCKTCNTMFNRDVNACSNMVNITTNALNKKERPEYLKR